jgi:hypothetical protein
MLAQGRPSTNHLSPSTSHAFPSHPGATSSCGYSQLFICVNLRLSAVGLCLRVYSCPFAVPFCVLCALSRLLVFFLCYLRKSAACRAVLSAIVSGTRDDGGRLCEGGLICGPSVFVSIRGSYSRSFAVTPSIAKLSIYFDDCCCNGRSFWNSGEERHRSASVRVGNSITTTR